MENKINKKEIHKIFQNIQQNRKEGTEELYNNHSKTIYKIAFSLLKDNEKSSDVMQNVFAKILNLKDEQLPKDSELTWLYQVTKNTCIDYIRKEKNECNIDEIYYIYEDKDIQDIIEKDKYNKMISKLNKKEQEIISLKVIGGFSFKEIAKIVNLPMGTVQWKYYNALHSLRLLISNIGMFFVTYIGYILSRKNMKKGNTEDVEIEETIENTSNLEDSEREKETQSLLKNEILEDKIVNSIEDTQTVTTVEPITSNIEKSISIGFFSLSIFFFMFSIIFLIKYIKSNKNKKRNV